MWFSAGLGQAPIRMTANQTEGCIHVASELWPGRGVPHRGRYPNLVALNVSAVAFFGLPPARSDQQTTCPVELDGTGFPPVGVKPEATAISRTTCTYPFSMKLKQRKCFEQLPRLGDWFDARG